MNFISVAEYAERHGVSERTVRNYCSQGRLEGAFLTGKTWNIPEYLRDTCLAAQDNYRDLLEYFNIKS